MAKGLGTVVVRNEFYRDGYRSLLRIAILQGLIIVGLIAVMFYVVHIHQPENRYFATTEDGRLVPMIALSEPNLSTPALLSWVAQSSTEVMTFGFNDYRRRLQEASRNFTRRGWESFTQALQASRIIDMVEANQQVVTAAPRGAPILQKEGEFNGRYQWTVQLPMIITYQSGSRSRSDNLLITLVVVRVPRLESPNGVGIEQWIAVPD
ncbi:MAG: type IV secretion protein IcmL [Alphaproteobacteria bacterium]|nr:type IV secretion protein IcmL [Alphaproteobacteria bacterium]